MNKFKGVFKKIDINQVVPNEWNPKLDIEESEENRKQYLKIKKNIQEKGLYRPIVVRQYNGKYQIIDGYHRWKACKELGFTEIMVFDLGKIPDELAKAITLDGIYLKVDPSYTLTAKLVKELTEELTIDEAVKLLPFDKVEIEEYIKNLEFEWSAFSEEKPKIEEQKKEEKEITCPKCGYKFKTE